jgi:hypothetical protein
MLGYWRRAAGTAPHLCSRNQPCIGGRRLILKSAAGPMRGHGVQARKKGIFASSVADGLPLRTFQANA